MTRYFLRHPLSGVAAAEVQDRVRGVHRGSRGRLDQRHRLACAHRRWQARGSSVTVAGGTSILPVTGYVLYDFLPVEEMFNVAEAVVRVFHRFGDCKHPQRNRMKFVVKALGWDGFRARFEEALDELQARRRRAPPVRSRERTRPRAAPDWAPAEAPTLQAVAAMAAHAGERPGHHARHRPAAAAAGCLSSAGCAATCSKQRQPGYYHVTVRLPLGDFTAGQMRVLADLAEAYGDGSMRLTVEQNVLFRWVTTRIAGAVLPAPRCGRTQRA